MKHILLSLITILSSIAARAQTTPALLQISDGAIYNYGQVRADRYASTIFTMTNLGNLVATNIQFLTLPAPFLITANSCGVTLSPGVSCTFTIRFGGPKTGAYATTLGLYYLDGVSRQAATLALSGAIVR